MKLKLSALFVFLLFEFIWFTVEMFLSKLKNINLEKKKVLLVNVEIPEDYSINKPAICGKESCAEIKLQNERLTDLCASQGKELESRRNQIIEKDLLLDQMHQMSAVLKEVVRNSDAELSTVKAQLDEKDSSLFELRKSKVRVTLDYERTDDELRRSRRELSSIAHEMLLQSEQITDLKKELALRKRSERELKDQARDAEAENKKLVLELIEITSKFETTDRELVSVKSVREDLSMQLCNVKQENATLEEQVIFILFIFICTLLYLGKDSDNPSLQIKRW